MFKKNIKRTLFLFAIIIFSLNAGYAHAVTRAQFLASLLDARGIDWSESPEYQSNNHAAFMLRTGYITDDAGGLNQNVTRREALRWCIESLGLSFEAELLSDYPSGFKDAGKFSPFERGCMVVATNMTPAIFAKADNFRGHEGLTAKEFAAVIQRVRSASNNFVLDMIRNPLTGLRVYIHREGVPTGIPTWRVYADGIKTRAAADVAKRTMKSQGFELSITGSGAAYGIRTQKLEDYGQVRKFIAFANARGLRYRILPSMTNINTSIVPKFWVMLTIDPSYWKIQPVFSGNGANELSPLSRIAANNGAKAAVNGGYFAATRGGQGYPIGALRVNGRNIGEAMDSRGILGWNDNDEAIFAVPAESEELNFWQSMSNIIQAGPLMLHKGLPVHIDEGFSSSFLATRHPRSAIGLNDSGQWVFVIIDGRNGMHSSGATISEFTEILRTHKVLYALNLDGGGSTEITINGKIYNMPSDGYERMISYGLGAVKLE